MRSFTRPLATTRASCACPPFARLSSVASRPALRRRLNRPAPAACAVVGHGGASDHGRRACSGDTLRLSPRNELRGGPLH
jgi:hypothetical protein